MKKTEQQNWMLAGALAAVLAVAAGCASSSYKKGAGTGTALGKAADKVVETQAKVSEALAALNDLVNQPQADLRPQFKKFSSAVKGVESSAKSLGNTADSMQSKGKAYFEQWDKDVAMIRNEDIRSRSEARKAEVAAQFDKVKTAYAAAKADFLPFRSELQDIVKFLEVDLTVGGLAAIKETVAKANKDVVPLNESLNKLVAEFKALGVALAPSAGTPE